MAEFTHLRERLPAILKALAVGIPAGFLFDRLHIPIPWMIGPMVAIATFSLMGVRLYSVPYGRQLGQLILGSAVSLYFTPTVVAELAANLPAIAAATVSVFLVGGLGALTLSRASGVDGKSTFFASIPGGAMAMAVLAERYGAQVVPVAVAHSLRVSIVVILIPVALTYGGFPLEAAAYRPDVPLNYSILAPWLAFGFGRGFGAAPVTEWLPARADFLRRGAHCEWHPAFRRAALDDGFRPTHVRPRTGSTLRASFFCPLQAVHTFRAVELALYRDRLGGRCRCSRLGFSPTYRYHDPRHLAGRLGRDDDYRASPADQRAVGSRLPLVSGGGRQHGHPVHLHLRGPGFGREYGPLECGGSSSRFKVQCSRSETSWLA